MCSDIVLVIVVLPFFIMSLSDIKPVRFSFVKSLLLKVVRILFILPLIFKEALSGEFTTTTPFAFKAFFIALSYHFEKFVWVVL